MVGDGGQAALAVKGVDIFVRPGQLKTAGNPSDDLRAPQLAGIAALAVIGEFDKAAVIAHQGDGGGIVDHPFSERADPAITKHTIGG